MQAQQLGNTAPRLVSHTSPRRFHQQVIRTGCHEVNQKVLACSKSNSVDLLVAMQCILARTILANMRHLAVVTIIMYAMTRWELLYWDMRTRMSYTMPATHSTARTSHCLCVRKLHMRARWQYCQRTFCSASIILCIMTMSAIKINKCAQRLMCGRCIIYATACFDLCWTKLQCSADTTPGCEYYPDSFV